MITFTWTLMMIILLDSHGGFLSFLDGVSYVKCAFFAHRVCRSGLAIFVVCIPHMTLGAPLVLRMADCLCSVEYSFRHSDQLVRCC